MKARPTNILRPLMIPALALLLTACGGGTGGSSANATPSSAEAGGTPTANSPASGPIGNGTTTGDTPAPGPLTRCDSARYPSPTWTQCEADNYAVTGENPTGHTDLMPGILAATTAYQANRLKTVLADPARQPNPNPCSTALLCPIDPRLEHWRDHGGIVKTVLYTSRSGATLSGHVWATKAGPAKRPGVVIINGSVIGFEQIYWYAAQALAKAGFVVMTFDTQGEGMSDQFGETPDATEDAFAGTPVLDLLAPGSVFDKGLGGNGLPFYDGGEDALNFFLSTPAKPYEPVPSRSTGTSHAGKQDQRVVSGRDNGYNPLWTMLDDGRIGLAGHSYGAEAASWLAQKDPRVTTAVAWDQLCVPVSPAPDELNAVTDDPINNVDGVPTPAVYGLGTACFGAPPGPAPAITKPALGISSDYALAPAPYLQPPNPHLKSRASSLYSQAGVDSGTIVIRGGTHYEYNDTPILLPASLRGIDLVTWYTVAWFRKYLMDDPAADKMLLSARWRRDTDTAAVDPAGDPNLYSWHYRSRLDITLHNGSRFDCEDLRQGCVGQVSRDDDGYSGDYSFVKVDTGD